MRTRRPAAVLTLGLIAGLALTGCRTSPTVAAYVGDETITVDELQTAVDDRRADPAVTAGDEPEYTRTVLTELVNSAVLTSAAEHFGVDPDPEGLPELLELLLEGQDPELFYEQAAAQGLTRADALERVRQVAVLASIAVAEGAVDETTEASLRATFEEGLAGQAGQVSLGFVNVPDQAAADAAVAALQADPGSYTTVAAPYLNGTTLPEPQNVTVDALASSQLPPDLVAQIAATPPGTAFATAVEGVPGLVVVWVGQPQLPTFEESREQLELAAVNEAAEAGDAIVAEYQAGLDIDVNPRYGSLEDGSVVPAAGGAVELLGTGD
ncbi:MULTISPECIES: peptidyl-prolyl cis-trans isomerase [unclassified Blastococcus]